jgi:hypothetical protein
LQGGILHNQYGFDVHAVRQHHINRESGIFATIRRLFFDKNRFALNLPEFLCDIRNDFRLFAPRSGIKL